MCKSSAAVVVSMIWSAIESIRAFPGSDRMRGLRMNPSSVNRCCNLLRSSLDGSVRADWGVGSGVSSGVVRHIITSNHHHNTSSHHITRWHVTRKRTTRPIRIIPTHTTPHANHTSHHTTRSVVISAVRCSSVQFGARDGQTDRQSDVRDVSSRDSKVMRKR